MAERLDQVDTEHSAFGRRASRLGLLSSIAFANFIALYRKFNADQPRDDRGRWTATDDVDATGSIGLIQNNAKTGNIKIDSLTEKLLEKLASIVDSIPDGSGLLYGIQVHSAFAQAVRDSGIPGLEAETTWFEGAAMLRYGLSGSIRTDVVLRSYDDSGSVEAVWDVKTGNATLSPSRVNQIRTKVGIGEDVPLIQLRVRDGATIKAILLQS